LSPHQRRFPPRINAPPRARFRSSPPTVCIGTDFQARFSLFPPSCHPRQPPTNRPWIRTDVTPLTSIIPRLRTTRSSTFTQNTGPPRHCCWERTTRRATHCPVFSSPCQHYNRATGASVVLRRSVGTLCWSIGTKVVFLGPPSAGREIMRWRAPAVFAGNFVLKTGMALPGTNLVSSLWSNRPPSKRIMQLPGRMSPVQPLQSAITP